MARASLAIRLDQEVFFAVRRLARRPGFCIPALLVLVLGMAASTAIFTFVYTVVLRPLPYPRADRLVRLQTELPGLGAGTVWNVGRTEFLYFQSSNTSFQAMGLYRFSQSILTAANLAGQPSTLATVAEVSAGLPAVLGYPPYLGRPMSVADNVEPRPSSVWLAYRFWKQRFGGDRAILGRTLTLDGQPLRVAGVLPERVELPEEAMFSNLRVDAWKPMWLSPGQPPSASHTLRALGRLRPAISLRQAQLDLARLTARLPEALPHLYPARYMQKTGLWTEVLPLRGDVLRDNPRVLWILFGAVLLMLLIAFADAANLVLACAEARRQEAAVRTALGASPARLAIHGLSEALVLTGLAAAAATILASWAVRVLVRLAPVDLPRVEEVHLDAIGIAFTILLALLAGLALGLLAPGRSDAAALGVGRCNTATRRHLAWRGSFVVVQVGLALLLMVGASLLLESARGLASVPPGFDRSAVIACRLVLPSAGYPSPASMLTLYRRIAERLAGAPDVQGVGYAMALPLSDYDACSSFSAQDHPPPPGDEPPCIPVFPVGPGYFHTMGIPLRGREQTWDEAGRDLPHVVVSAALAKRFWPAGENPLGRYVKAARGRSFRVVGVAGDVRANGLDQAPVPAIYLPLLAEPAPAVEIVVRARRGAPELQVSAVRAVVASLDHQVPVSDVVTLKDLVARSTATLSLASWLLTVVAGVALTIITIGLYGLLSYLVVSRRREIGIRMAVGARPGQVRRLILGHAARLVAAGALLGLAGALVATRFLRSLLFGVSPLDPATLGGATLLLALVALAATWLPTLTATRIAPAEAARHE